MALWPPLFGVRVQRRVSRLVTTTKGIVMMTMDDIKAALRKSDVTPTKVAELIGQQAHEFAKDRIDEAWQASRFANDRAELAESAAKAQIASLQKMYVGMLTECHQEIAELKGLLAAKTPNSN